LGPQHLRRSAAPVALVASVALGVVALGCRGAATPAVTEGSRVTLAGPAGGRGAHVQFVRALPMAERVALVQRFKARNGAEWSITLGGGGAPDDVDAIRGVVRRAKREGDAGANADADADAGANENENEMAERAIRSAVAFVAKNAEFLGLAPADVATLDVTAAPAKTPVYGAWVAVFGGHMPMRGYEGFEAVASTINLAVYLGDDGAVRYFVNFSHVNPRLVLDTHALLGPDDKRLMRYVLGREVFVVFDDPRRPNARVRELRRLSLGRVEDADVRAVRLTIHVSPGPRDAYVSYTLAYAVDVRRQGSDFRFVVDADTGDLLEDAVVPVLPSSPLNEP
jgi:hypothetical protein